MFPKRFRWRMAVVLTVFAGTFFLWWKWGLTPLQHYYFWTYLNCTVQGGDPVLSSEVHWLYKTAAYGKQELATDQDVVSSAPNRSDSLALQLSPADQKIGWTGLIRGPEGWIKIPRLQPFLQQQFYDEEHLWWMLFTPLLWSVAILLCLFAVQEFLTVRQVARRFNSHSVLSAEPSPDLLRRWTCAMRSLRLGTLNFRKPLIGKLTLQAVPKPPAEPAVESSSTFVPTGLPFFGAAQSTPKEKFVWTRKNEIL